VTVLPTDDRSSVDVPLCVGLKGGLVPNSPVAEAALSLMKRAPSAVFKVPLWRMRGRAVVAREVAARVHVGAEGLPYDAGVLARIDEARAQGRRVVLATTTPEVFAEPVAAHLDRFDEVVVVGGEDGRALGRELARRFGDAGFDFVGGRGDRAGVGPFARDVRAPDPSDGPSAWKVLRRTLRVHQWLKNLLVFLPVLAGQRFTEVPVLLTALLAFIAFSLTASSVYVVNDVLDLREDRKHPTKRNRPFASGALRLARAPILLAILLTGAGAITGLLLPPAFRLALGVYLLLTFAYSLKLKGAILVDVVTLAGLYTLRIIAGSAATGIEPSVWLLGFSLFFFLSLALVKRYAELHEKVGADEDLGERSEDLLPGRSYQPRDLPVLISLGVATGCVAVLVLALYVISDEFARHYRYPFLLWQLCPLALYWIGRAWIVVARDEMADDPVVWAVKDQLSRWVAIVAILILVLAR
jgi:4-hydroxybenzoate polyprenyltransferase